MSSRMNENGEERALLRPRHSLDETIEKVNAVTPAALLEVSRTCLPDGDLALVALGPFDTSSGEREPMITVAVSGAAGRMGREVVRAVSEQRDMRLVAAIDRVHVGEDAGALAGIAELSVPIADKPGETLAATHPDVLVDFTLPGVSAHIALSAVRRGIRTIIGTSGLTPTDRSALRTEAEEQGVAVLVVPNFALGAVLMLRFAEEAAKCFPNAEIIELHHDGKLDSPSGTARNTAERIALARRDKPRSSCARR